MDWLFIVKDSDTAPFVAPCLICAEVRCHYQRITCNLPVKHSVLNHQTDISVFNRSFQMLIHL